MGGFFYLKTIPGSITNILCFTFNIGQHYSGSCVVIYIFKIYVWHIKVFLVCYVLAGKVCRQLIPSIVGMALG